MKKKTAKLRLSRETLRVMSSGQLSRVRGALQSMEGGDDCDQDLTIPDSVCILCGGETWQSCVNCQTGAYDATCVSCEGFCG